MKHKAKKGHSKNSGSLLSFGGVMLHLVRLITAAVFVFSGFVKAVDPLGTVYKIQDYLTAFGGIWQGLATLAFPAAIIMILFELLLGLCLLFQVRFRLAAVFSLLFMLVMTPLTLYIAIKNPVTDCGCFGDALVITNWQTFIKNIFFLIFSIILVWKRKSFRPLFHKKPEWVILIVFAVGALSFMVYNLNRLPIIDFRPYKVSVNIAEAMSIPDDAPGDVFEYNFVYEKEGARKTFGLENLPDSSWTFVSQESRLIQEGYRPPINDFLILSADYDDVTDELIRYPGKTYIAIMYDLNKASSNGVEEVRRFHEQLKDDGTRFVAITASSHSVIKEFKDANKLHFTFYSADDILLKTMIRSNPGLILLEDGTISAKWHWRSIKKIYQTTK